MLLKNGLWSWHSAAAFTFKYWVSTDDFFFPVVREKIKINKGGRAKCSLTLLLPLESWELRSDNLKIASVPFCHPSQHTCSGLVSVHMLSVHTVSGAEFGESVFVEGNTVVPQDALLRHMESLEGLVWCQRGGVSPCLPHQRAWHFQKPCLSPKSVPYWWITVGTPLYCWSSQGLPSTAGLPWNSLPLLVSPGKAEPFALPLLFSVSLNSDHIPTHEPLLSQVLPQLAFHLWPL